MSNSDNPGVGARFQRDVMLWFESHYDSTFELEVKIPIGSWLIDSSQYKDHKFDIVSADKSIVVECKCYSWTESGNVPSAKMGFVNEAAFYLSLVKRARKKIIVMLKSYNENRKQTLAEYYYNTNKHLLGDVIIAEYDPPNEYMNFINESEINRIWKNRVNRFALRYLSLYKNPNTTEDMVCVSFGDECFELGFNMDCYSSFKKTYNIENPDDVYSLKNVISCVEDIELLGSAVFSKWRGITHWSYASNCLDDDNREWFISAFSQLVRLTGNEEIDG